MAETKTKKTAGGNEVTVVQADVICAGISYFTKDVVLDANGDPEKNPATGEYVTVTNRNEASFGETVELTSHEFNRIAKLGGVREHDAENKPLSMLQRPSPTPFTAPFVGDDGEVVQWTDPVMGDPRPHGPGTDDRSIVSGPGVLTPEQHAELRARAEGSQDPEAGSDDVSLYDSYMELDKDELKADAEQSGVEVERSDGRTDLEPLKEDYARALTAHVEAQDSEGGEEG